MPDRHEAMCMYITLPKKPEVIKKDRFHATIEIENLYPGYGMTLGNALRRVLLSSLEGSAATLVKIKGASHEFSTIPNVMEDVVEILLNIKKLRFKLHSEEPQKVHIKVHGEKKVTAKDIEAPSQVEVENMRVGERTDFDRLRFFIETDGIIDPEEAFTKAARTLVDQFQELIAM